MGGFLGIGGSSASTDRNRYLDASGKLDSVFNWALPAGKDALATGQGTTAKATDYWTKMLNAGRGDIQQMSAPAINTATDQADAAKRDAAVHGTQRSGGTAAMERESGTQTQATIDDIINKNLFGTKQSAAQGLASTGLATSNLGSNLLGLGTNVESNVMGAAADSRKTSADIAQQQGQGIGSLIGAFLMGF